MGGVINVMCQAGWVERSPKVMCKGGKVRWEGYPVLFARVGECEGD